MKITLVVVFIVFLFAGLSHAGNVTFIKEYTYQASEIDSKVTARAIAVEQVKRLVLEELGTYLMSETEVKNMQLAKDTVVTLSAGIVQSEILSEKWNGENYWLKAKVAADPAETTKALQRLVKDKEKTGELEDARKKADEAFKEIARLKKELAAVKADKNKQKEYAKAVNTLSATDWFKKGKLFSNANKYDEAIDAYGKAIEFDIYYTKAYNNRGIAYAKKEQYDKAILDYSKAIEIDPTYAKAYYNRGIAYRKKGQNDRAIEDYNKAIEIDPNYAKAYNNRGNIYKNNGQYGRAISDFQKACDFGDQKGCENLQKALKNR